MVRLHVLHDTKMWFTCFNLVALYATLIFLIVKYNISISPVMLVFDMSFFSFKSDYEEHAYVLKKKLVTWIFFYWHPFFLFFLFLFILLSQFFVSTVLLPSSVFDFCPLHSWSDKDLLTQTRTIAMSFIKCASNEAQHQYKLVKDISFWKLLQIPCVEIIADQIGPQNFPVKTWKWC